MSATNAASARENHRASEIAICGVGVAGLTLAARLAQMGRKPILFEARSETATTSEGVFLTLAPNGMNGLRTIGCDEEVKASGIATTGIEIRNAKAKRLAFAAQSDHEAELARRASPFVGGGSLKSCSSKPVQPASRYGSTRI